MVKYPNAKQFRKELEKNPLETVYLFLGEEEGEKDKVIQQMLARIFPDETERRLNVGTFHLSQENLMEAADFALASSMFSTDRVCLVRDIGGVNANEKNKTLFAEMVNGLPDGTRLILTAVENRPPAILGQKLLAGMKVVQFWRLFDQDIYNYLQIRFQKMGIPYDPQALEVLIARTGKDIKKIDEALDMIRDAGQVEQLTAEVMKSLVSDVKSVSVFEFIDLLFRREKKALSVLKKLLEEGTPELSMLTLVVRQAEILERYHAESAKGGSIDDLLKTLGVQERNRDAFFQYVKHFPAEKVATLFPALGTTDYRLKSARQGKTLLANPITDLATWMLFGS